MFIVQLNIYNSEILHTNILNYLSLKLAAYCKWFILFFLRYVFGLVDTHASL